MIKQGEVYLVNFGKKYNNEFGKIRPAVVMQNSFLNHSIKDNIYKSVLVVPLSTSILGGDYRLEIKARDKLKKNSECVANWICTLDIDRFLLEKNILTILNENELKILKNKICSLME